MKNIEQILADAGVTITDEQKTAIGKEVKENYKTINDWQKQVDDAKALQDTLAGTQEKLKAFDGVDVAAKDKMIADLQADLEKKETEHQAMLADRDFQDMLKECIAAAKGRNSKAITALLDVETLKKSKNQRADVEAAVKALTEAEDSKMLFGEPEPRQVGTGNVIGQVYKAGSADADEAAMRAAMGLPPITEKK